MMLAITIALGVALLLALVALVRTTTTLRRNQERDRLRRVYIVRHQAAGLLTECPFAEPPTKLQLASVTRALAARYTRSPDKAPWWLRVVDVPLLDRETLPFAAEPKAPPQVGPPGVSGKLSRFQISATGTVTPPKG